MREKRKRKKKRRNNGASCRMEAATVAPATVAPATVAPATVSAAGGAGAPPPAKEPLVGLIIAGSADKELVETLLTESKKWEMPVSPSGLSGKFDKEWLDTLLKKIKKGEMPASPSEQFETELVTLSDPSIGYLRKIYDQTSQFIKIIFCTLDSKEVGSVLFQFIEDKEDKEDREDRPILYINLIYTEGGERGKGYGKRILAAVMDIARRAGKHKVSLGSFSSAVSFYLEVDPPFTFNNPSNKSNYNAAYGALIKNGVANTTAKRSAANVFKKRAVPMTAKLRKSRRANRRKGTRRRAST